MHNPQRCHFLILCKNTPEISHFFLSLNSVSLSGLMVLATLLNETSSSMQHNPVIFPHPCIPLALACLHLSQEAENDLSIGQLAAPRVHQEQEAEGPLCADASFLSGGNRPAVYARPKNSLCLSCVHPISLHNGCAEQVMR